MKLTYDVNQTPPLRKNLVYAFQQLLAIMAATLLVPILVDGSGTYMSQPAALCGAGFGTLFYIYIATRKKSPVFLGSSFAFFCPWRARWPSASWASSWALCSRAWCM